MSTALQLADRGFFIFPCQDNSKKPLIPWREQSTTDPKVIFIWEQLYPSCNWGIDCGKSGLAVVDVDRKKEDGFKTLLNRGLALPDTMVFQTPSGGEHHVYFGDIKTGAGDIGPGIDTRGAGGYIVAPGSTIQGKQYKVKHNRSIQQVPDWVVKAAPPRKPAPAAAKTNIELDIPKNILAAVHYLEKRAQPAIEGQGGDAHTFRVACAVRDYGVSETTALEILTEHWNSRCEPPWGPGELMLKVQNAYTYGQNIAGAKTPQAVFDKPVEGAPGVDLLPMMNLKECFSPAPPQEWLVEGWILGKEMTLFTGKEGVGKSVLALQLAMSSAYGLDWMGFEIDKPRPALYISYEDDRDEIKRRVQDISLLPEYAFLDKGAGVDPDKFQAVPLVGENATMVREDQWELKPGPLYARLHATLARLGWQEPLIIFDTLSDIYMANENKRSLVSEFIKHYLAKFKIQYGATIITLAHPPKSESEFSGSTAWPAAHRGAIIVEPYPAKSLPNHRVVRLWKGNRTTTHGKQFPIEWQRGSFKRVNIVDMPEAEEAATARDMMLVYDHIEEAAQAGTYLSLSAQANFTLKDRPIRDEGEAIMSQAAKKAHALALISLGKVINKDWGKKRGLFPSNMMEAKDE